MNQNSPGSESVEDIEMIDIDGIPLKPKTGPASSQTIFAVPDAYDGYGESDDGSRGLLSGSIERSRFDQPPGKIWAQVRGIVIEVLSALLSMAILADRAT